MSSDPSILSRDVQIHSIEMSSSRACNSVNSIQTPHSRDFSSPGNFSYITRNSPRVITTETYLPASESSIQLSPYNSKTYSSSDAPTLSYESFEKHFLWNTSLFHSTTRPMNERMLSHSKLDNIFIRQNYGNISAETNKISNIANDNEEFVNQESHSIDMSKTTLNDNPDDYQHSKSIAIKRNPYSIEEILKKPEKKMRYVEPFVHNHQVVKHFENVHGTIQSIAVNSETTECFNHTAESDLINRKGRIRLKVYDISV